MTVFDLTHVIREGMPVYPGTEKPTLQAANSYEKDGFRETKLCLYSHTGTHIDAPAHLYDGALTLDRFSVDQFIGKALVVDCTSIPEGSDISLSLLEKYSGKIEMVDFLLFRLGWDKRWGEDAYFGDYPCLAPDLLNYILDRDYKGIGFDVISLDPISSLDRHKKLFKGKKIINIENLCNLEVFGDETFWFSCFPIKLENSDGAPCRAIGWFE